VSTSSPIPLDDQSFFAWLKCGEMKSSPSSMWIVCVCKGKAAANSLLSIVGCRWCRINKFYSSYFSLSLTITQETANKGQPAAKKEVFFSLSLSLYERVGVVVYPHPRQPILRASVYQKPTHNPHSRILKERRRERRLPSVWNQSPNRLDVSDGANLSSFLIHTSFFSEF
jgi:hypothetical protein